MESSLLTRHAQDLDNVIYRILEDSQRNLGSVRRKASSRSVSMTQRLRRWSYQSLEYNFVWNVRWNVNA
jgi:hypothetical protein